MGIGFREIYGNDMKIIDANFKLILEKIKSLEDRLIKLEKTVGAPHFETEQDDGETES